MNFHGVVPTANMGQRQRVAAKPGRGPPGLGCRTAFPAQAADSLPLSENISSPLFSWTLTVKLWMDAPSFGPQGCPPTVSPCFCCPSPPPPPAPQESDRHSHPALGGPRLCLRLLSNSGSVMVPPGFSRWGLLFSPCRVCDSPSTRDTLSSTGVRERPRGLGCLSRSPASLWSCSYRAPGPEHLSPRLSLPGGRPSQL